MVDSIVLLLAFSVIYIFIIEIFTVLFRLTGLTEDVARFQVISLLTACGFTTSKSEVITITKRRRRLASIAILFGYIFSLIIVSVVVNVFLSMTASEVNTFVGIGVTISVVFLVVFVLIKSKKAKIYFDAFINKVYLRLSKRRSNNIIIMDVFGHKIMASIYLASLPAIVADIPLQDSGLLHEYGIQVLIVTRNGEALEQIDGSTRLMLHDNIIVLGKEKQIHKLFENQNPQMNIKEEM